MPNMEEIMIPEADHHQWSKLPASVQQCVRNVFEANVPSSELIRAVVDYHFQPAEGPPIHLFSGTYLAGEEVPEFGKFVWSSLPELGDQVRITNVTKRRIGTVDYIAVFLDELEGDGK